MASVGAGDRKSWAYVSRSKMIPHPDVPASPLWNHVHSVACYTAIGIITHPLNHAKFLMQIGHEPIEPKLKTDIFGKPVLLLPNVFRYVRYIHRRDGWSGIFRGCPEGVCAQISSTVTQMAVDRWLFSPADYVEEDNGPEDIYRPEDSKPKHESQLGLARRVSKQAVSRGAAVIVSHPFHVIMCRTMVQFVGGEMKYTGIFASFREVHNTDGLKGFFAGLVPRLICEISTLVVCEYVRYWINRLVKDPFIKVPLPLLSQVLVSSFTYPFTVVANCMTINNCGLAGGLPPHMPVYEGWTDCYSHLKRLGQLSRGGGIGDRTLAKGPTAVILASSLKSGPIRQTDL